MSAIQSIGDYDLVKILGEGSFGKVFLARHRFIKKLFALKLLPEEFSSDPDFMERFEKDVAILASLDHPSIVKLHNISSSEGQYFLVSDVLIDEKESPITLTSYLKKKGKILSETQVEALLRQVALALDYAHRTPFGENHLVHQGLKFSNIFVDENEKSPKVFLTDFALTHLIGEGRMLMKSYENSLKNMFLEDSCFRGEEIFSDFYFLAPEQKKLFPTKVDSKADTYAFGVLAYFLITRRFPEGYFELPSKVALEYKLNWDLLITQCLNPNPLKRPLILNEAMNALLPPKVSDVTSLDILSWEEVEKKVENAMQMSFEFSEDDPLPKKAPHESPKPTPKVEEESSHKPIFKPKEIERPSYDADPGYIFQKELTVSAYKPQEVEIKDIEPLLTEMVIISGGTFWRGSNEGARDEGPRHRVTLSSFALDIHPVTNEQFVRFLEAMGGEKDVNNNDLVRLRDSRIKKSAGKYTIESGYMKHPVVGVTWYGAQAYAKWVGKRLPYEAEWEVAALGGLENMLYPTGTDIDHSQANFFNSDTTAVMSYPPNGYGLFDTVGNVYEWCFDWYAYNYYDTSIQEPENPKGPPQGVYRVLRGGCWKSLKEDLRCSHRHRNNPGSVNGTYGFRCAADVT